MPNIKSSTALPFSEAISFFSQKLNIPTATWTDIYGLEHDKAFMVAGAIKDDLIADFKNEIDKALSTGTGYAEFRKAFPQIVKKHGWSYNGGEGWRSRVIYHTNIQQAYNAGNFTQAKAISDHRPYWEYVHNAHGHSKAPRLEHLAWNGLILRHDDPWWDSHRPMNGWGCNCGFNVLSERDLKKTGRTAPDKAPTIEWEDKVVGIRGPNPRTVSVPKGIDPGFEHAPGSSVLSTLLKKRFEQISQLPLSSAINSSARLLASDSVLKALSKDYDHWVDDINQGNLKTAGKSYDVGIIEDDIVDALKQQNVDLNSLVISLSQGEIRHLLADARKGDKSLTLDQVKNLPQFLARPKAVIWDNSGRRPALLYIFDAPNDKAGRISIRVNHPKSKKNVVVSGSIVPLINLLQDGKTVIKGKI